LLIKEIKNMLPMIDRQKCKNVYINVGAQKAEEEVFPKEEGELAVGDSLAEGGFARDAGKSVRPASQADNNINNI
jgi:hypothetical protein